ncbi:MAG: hypothetical protein VX777_07380 [Chlamydiota bacterium]|nr:hypothetical protein [Chlamydiota bacterium]
MRYELTNLLNTNLSSMGINTNASKKASLVFLGNSQECKDKLGNTRTVTCIYPLDYESPETQSRGMGYYENKRLALITETNNVFSLMVHEDYINSLPKNHFYLGSKIGVVKNFIVRKNISLNSMPEENYKKLLDLVQSWIKKCNNS